MALDSKGAEAARPFIKPDATEYPRFVYELMGWDPDTSRIATPAYPCLIDEYHKVAQLYGTVNVPAAVWIDENGRMARSPDNAGACDAFRTMDRTTFKMQEESAAQAREVRRSYIAALRDWIENGAASKHVMPDSEPLQHSPNPTDQASAMSVARPSISCSTAKLVLIPAPLISRPCSLPGAGVTCPRAPHPSISSGPREQMTCSPHSAPRSDERCAIRGSHSPYTNYRRRAAPYWRSRAT